MSALAIHSADAAFDRGMAWAIATARAYRRTGQSGEVPCYWAGLLDREAVYIRDLVHQAPAAHLLGMQVENFTMLRAFAGTATPERQWYPHWSLGFDARIFEMDFHHDEDCAREIPMVFEPVEMAWSQYQWSGERAWIDDVAIREYSRRAMKDFVALHDRGEGVAGTDGRHAWPYEGIASYNEGGEGLQIAGDGLASQHAAQVAWAQMQEACGAHAGAQASWATAAHLQRWFAEHWVLPDGTIARGVDHAGKLVTGFGELNSIYIPAKFLCHPGPATERYLDFIEATVPYQHGVGFEMRTYLPEAFFPYGRDEAGWRRLMHMLDSRNPYPEISFVAVGQTVEGVCGVVPDAPHHRVMTVPHLPDALAWIAVDGITIGGHVLDLRHERGRSTVHHRRGPGPMTWLCAFPGQGIIRRDGRDVVTTETVLHGRRLTMAGIDMVMDDEVSLTFSPAD